ncbi:hypothetical protein BGY98DRAFT_933899 [Russula aff. rugulosa BPL654]|nr:hypothetical protein BGY98DRAFT_933899 [Russula aff. rugulosa BPL654]
MATGNLALLEQLHQICMVKTQYINWLSSLHSSGIPEEFLMGFVLNTNPSCTVATFFGELDSCVLLPRPVIAVQIGGGGGGVCGPPFWYLLFMLPPPTLEGKLEWFFAHLSLGQIICDRKHSRVKVVPSLRTDLESTKGGAIDVEGADPYRVIIQGYSLQN